MWVWVPFVAFLFLGMFAIFDTTRTEDLPVTLTLYFSGFVLLALAIFSLQWRHRERQLEEWQKERVERFKKNTLGHPENSPGDSENPPSHL